ncbi:serine phosphatase rsbU [Streptomyces laurentii]|uniref:Serine phosphatase rsbU n=1 Tax=Streptomyces laurentii TaxID=39478 RepID=A0A169NY31_STRLU|nr:serine phosphatase rsbU [Streptomyces laurentii]
MSEIPETVSGATRGVVWQSSPPGSIYDYIRVASFSIGPDGLVDQWSRRAVELFGVSAEEARGKDPVEVFMPANLRERGHRRVREILDGKEWTGLVPFRQPGEEQPHGIAEMYVMPSETENGERTALCIVVDVRALRRIETDLAASQAIFGQSPFGFLLFGTDLTVKRTNRRFATVFGGTTDDHRGRTAYDYLPHAEAERLTAALRTVLETGEAVTDLEIVGAAPGTRDRRHWSINLYRVHSGSGRPVGVAGLGIDVTRRYNAAREAASARRNLALLNEAGARIGTTLDLQATARELLDVAVPGFCDFAAVDLYQGLLTGDEAPPGRWGSSTDVGYGGAGSAEVRRVAVASAVPDTPVRLGRQRHPGAPAPDVPPSRDGQAAETTTAAPGRVAKGRDGADPAATGREGGVQGAAAPDRTDNAVAPFAGDVCGDPEPIKVGSVHRFPFNSPCAGALRTGRVHTVPGPDGSIVQSTLVVPMVAHDTVVGLAQFSRAMGSEPFGTRDRALAVELAARAAVCIDNARLYRREHERALILQRSLLPPGDPEAAGLDIACRYLPGTVGSEVGGDWFDVIELPGHRTALVIGDVMGRGLRAAVAMGELRTAVRTLAQLDLEPAEVLSHLDETARGLGAPAGAQQSARAHKARGPELAEVYLATCVYAVYDPVTRRCTFANAGHLPPVLVEPGAPARLLDVPPGMPLGVGGEPFEEVTVELPEGALLALYTDGLVESRDHPLDEGLNAFRSALTGPDRPLEDVCDHVLTTLDTGHGEDDIALLMARIQGLPSEAVGDWRLPREPRSVGRARELARAQLTAWELEPLVDTVELLVSELVTNALRYGEGEIRLRLLRERTLVCEVWDAGLVQPRRRRAKDTDEGGRGLQLVGLLSAAWGSRRTPRGKTVWFELALPDGEGSAEPTVDQLLSMF